VRTLIFSSVTIFIVAGILADPATKDASKAGGEERLVFITGSLIPQRVKVEPIGTKTVSPVRVINRSEIDRKGRQTTPGVLTDEPSLRIIGH
jgi:hypothetical protein